MTSFDQSQLSLLDDFFGDQFSNRVADELTHQLVSFLQKQKKLHSDVKTQDFLLSDSDSESEDDSDSEDTSDSETDSDSGSDSEDDSDDEQQQPTSPNKPSHIVHKHTICDATTKNGRPCTHKAKHGSKCGIHYKK